MNLEMLKNISARQVDGNEKKTERNKHFMIRMRLAPYFFDDA